MYKKNYLTREEQGLWGYIQDKEIIDTELVEQIFPNIKKKKRITYYTTCTKKIILKEREKTYTIIPKS